MRTQTLARLRTDLGNLLGSAENASKALQLMQGSDSARNEIRRILSDGAVTVGFQYSDSGRRELEQLNELGVLNVRRERATFSLVGENLSSYSEPKYEIYFLDNTNTRLREVLSPAVVYAGASPETAQILDECLGRMVTINGDFGLPLIEDGVVKHVLPVLDHSDPSEHRIGVVEVTYQCLRRQGAEFTTGGKLGYGIHFIGTPKFDKYLSMVESARRASTN